MFKEIYILQVKTILCLVEVTFQIVQLSISLLYYTILFCNYYFITLSEREKMIRLHLCMISGKQFR